MSSRAARLARVADQLADEEHVVLVVVRGVDAAGRDVLVGALGGTPRTRAAALAAWYDARRLQPTREHLAEIRAGGVRWRRGPRKDRR